MIGVKTLEGQIKWYNASKGFGFVTVNGVGDVFMHATVVKKKSWEWLPEPHEKVIIKAINSNKGWQVVEVVSFETAKKVA